MTTIKKWNQKTDSQKLVALRELVKIIADFERKHDVTFKQLSMDGCLPNQMSEEIKRSAIEIVVKENQQQMVMNTRNRTPEEVYTAIMKDFASVPMKDQNQILSNFLSAIKTQRNKLKNDAFITASSATANATEMEKHLSALEYITSGDYDRLNMR